MATPAIRVMPGTTWFLTRRTVERKFLLVPKRKIRRLLRFILAVGARKYGVEINAYALMSNHLHVVYTDMLGKRPKFRAWVFQNIARVLNKEYKRVGCQFWCGRGREREPMSEWTVETVMLYTMANPVRAGLVRRAWQWEECVSLPHHLREGYRPDLIERPDGFSKRSKATPEEIRLKVHLPPLLRDGKTAAEREQTIKRMERRLAEIETQCAEKFESVLGFSAAEAIEFDAAPTTPRKPHKPMPPVFMHECKVRRAELHEERTEYLDEYEAAMDRWAMDPNLTALDVGFPEGAWRWIQIEVARRKRREELLEKAARNKTRSA